MTMGLGSISANELRKYPFGILSSRSVGLYESAKGESTTISSRRDS